MTSQPAIQTITRNILPDISKSKGNQAIKIGQLIECYAKNIFFSKILQKNEAKRLAPDLLLIFKKALNELKASGLHFSFNMFRWLPT